MKRTLVLILALHGAAALDSWATRRNLRAGGVEYNPLLGRRPSEPRVWVEIQGDAIAADVALWRARHHRKLAEAAAVAVIAGHAEGAVVSIALHGAPSKAAPVAPTVKGR